MKRRDKRDGKVSVDEEVSCEHVEVVEVALVVVVVVVLVLGVIDSSDDSGISPSSAIAKA